MNWKKIVLRATGATQAKANVKRKIAKATGIPTTKSGRDKKMGRMVRGGCGSVLLFGLGGLGAIGTGLYLLLA